MKRSLMISVLLLVLTVLALEGVVASETKMYEVKKGDTLWGISQRFSVDLKDLIELNDIANPELIHPGQIIKISEKTRGFDYRHPNADPFGRARDPSKLISKFSLPQEVKSEFVDIAEDFLSASGDLYEVKKGDTLWKLEAKFGIKAETIYEMNKEVIDHPKKWLFPGQVLEISEKTETQKKFDSEISYLSSRFGHIDHLEEMGFGKYRVVSDVRVRFSQPQKSHVWNLNSGGYEYFLVLPLNCYNWGWYKIERPEPVPDPEPKPEPKVEVTPLTLPEPERRWGPDYEFMLYTGRYWGAQRDNRHNRHLYGGGHFSFFPHSWDVRGGRFRIGPSVQYIKWTGEADMAVDYRGDTLLFGLKTEYLTRKSETALMTYVGQKKGRVSGRDFPYRSRERADMLVLEASHNRWYDRQWFPQLEFGTRLAFSSDERKRSYWAGTRIEEPAEKQGEYLGRIKADIYRNYVATPTFELSAGWREFDKTGVMEPRAGIKWFDDLFATEVSYQIPEYYKNSAAVHFRLDVKKLLETLSDN